jgi:hypothetical protein
LCFGEYELGWFMESLNDGRALVEFPTCHGKELLCKTPTSNLCLMFSKAEVAELVAMLNEVVIMMEVRKTLRNVN